MPQDDLEFENRDLRRAVFWDVDLTGARFRDVDLSGVHVSHSMLVDVDIDARIERVVINGVDVTTYVNERDPWFPLRSMLGPPDAAGLLATWDELERAWAPTLDEARALPDAARHASVGGEWSFVQTLRHLVFAMDKWCTVPILGEPAFHPFGLPNSGSADLDWPGIDREADPAFDEVLAVRAERATRFRALLAEVTPDDVEREVDVLENGRRPVLACLHVVLEEEFQHLRYARRDLAVLG